MDEIKDLVTQTLERKRILAKLRVSCGLKQVLNARIVAVNASMNGGASLANIHAGGAQSTGLPGNR